MSPKIGVIHREAVVFIALCIVVALCHATNGDNDFGDWDNVRTVLLIVALFNSSALSRKDYLRFIRKEPQVATTQRYSMTTSLEATDKDFESIVVIEEAAV